MLFWIWKWTETKAVRKNLNIIISNFHFIFTPDWAECITVCCLDHFYEPISYMSLILVQIWLPFLLTPHSVHIWIHLNSSQYEIRVSTSWVHLFKKYCESTLCRCYAFWPKFPVCMFQSTLIHLITFFFFSQICVFICVCQILIISVWLHFIE